MPQSPSSSAQAARESVARRLRDLRKEADLTVIELAERCGWHYSKTSRIENARTGPSPADIRRWCDACRTPERTADLIAASQEAEAMYSEWQQKVRSGLRQLQESYVQLFRDTRLFRIYSSTLVPGLLQDHGYATALLEANADFHEVPNDAAEAAAARVERSQIVHEAGHRCVLLIEEAVLHYQLGDADSMAAQLGYLLTAGARPNVALGIIPSSTHARSIWPAETFHIYDDTLVSVELLSAQVNVTQPSEIALYIKAFEQLRERAVYGGQARSLILKAIQALG